MPIYYQATTAAGTATIWLSSSDNTTACTTSSSTASTGYVTWYDWHDAANVDVAPVVHRRYDNYRAERERQAAVVREHKEPAQERAENLLLSHLTKQQRKTFRKNKWFIVEGGRSKQKYRIQDRGHLVANIEALDGDKVKHRLCAHCDLRAIPMGDHLLAQKLMLEFDEDEFLKIANRHAA
jgi:hypothetical protein